MVISHVELDFYAALLARHIMKRLFAFLAATFLTRGGLCNHYEINPWDHTLFITFAVQLLVSKR